MVQRLLSAPLAVFYVLTVDQLARFCELDEESASQGGGLRILALLSLIGPFVATAYQHCDQNDFFCIDPDVEGWEEEQEDRQRRAAQGLPAAGAPAPGRAAGLRAPETRKIVL